MTKLARVVSEKERQKLETNETDNVIDVDEDDDYSQTNIMKLLTKKRC